MSEIDIFNMYIQQIAELIAVCREMNQKEYEGWKIETMKTTPIEAVIKVPADKKISQQDRKDLRTLADDFGILYRQDAQEVIKTCRSYAEGQRKIMRIYTAVYMK